MPLISVIIPTFNGSKYIVETIKSVLAQDLNDYEIIIIDDGSTDNTVELIQNLSPKISVVKQKNKGIAEARNRGISLATGKYIAFLDHDDVLHPEKLSAQLLCFKNNPDAGVIFGNFRRWYGGDENEFFGSKLNPDLINSELSGWIYHKFLLTNWVLFSSALFKSEVIQDIGLFNSELPPSDDWDYAVRVSRKYKFYKMKQEVVLYRTHDNQTSRKVILINSEAEFRDKIIKQYGKVGTHGETISDQELSYRNFKSHFDFGLSHYLNGDARIATKSFYHAILYRPFFIKSYIFLGSSLIKLLINRK